MKRRIALCIAAGLLITFAIAWAQYLISPRSGWIMMHTLDDNGNILRSERMTLEQTYPYVGRKDMHGAYHSPLRIDGTNWWPLHGWQGEAYGWPWRGLYNMYRTDENDPRRLPYLAIGIRLPGIRTDPNTGERMERALPIVPSPMGLADIALWSAVAGAVLWVGLRTRGMRRRRRGLCERCAHNRAGIPASAPCPECGAASPA